MRQRAPMLDEQTPLAFDLIGCQHRVSLGCNIVIHRQTLRVGRPTATRGYHPPADPKGLAAIINARIAEPLSALTVSTPLGCVAGDGISHSSAGGVGMRWSIAQWNSRLKGCL